MKNTQALEYLSSSRNRRLLRLLVAAMCFLTVTWLAFNTSFRSHQLLHTNADHTGRSLTKQLALNAALPLSRMDTPQLRLCVITSPATNLYCRSGSTINKANLLSATMARMHHLR